MQVTDTTAVAQVATIDYPSGCRSHSLDDVIGYRVVKTIGDDGVVIVTPNAPHGELVEVFDGATSYGRALEVARSIRTVGGAWAVVDTLYACGTHAGR